MFDFDKINASKFYSAPPVERVVEFSPPGIDADNIAKVLSLAVDAKCNSVEPYDGYVQVDGRTNFRLAYLDRDGQPKGVDYNADFSVKAEGDFSVDDSVGAEICVVEADAQSGGGLTLSAALEVKATAIKREELDVLIGAQNCYTTQKSVYLPEYIASKNVISSFADEVEVGGEVSSVLALHTTCALKKAEVADSGVSLAATVYSTVTYIEGGEIKQKNFAVDIDEDLGLDGVGEGDTVKVSATVKNAKVVLQGVTDDNVIKIEGDVNFKIQAFRCRKRDVVSDLFALSNEVVITRSNASFACFDGSGYFSENIQGTAMLGDNRAAATAIAAIPYAGCYASNAYLDGSGNLVVEGVVNADVIYVDENGYNSVRTEIPFSVDVSSKSPFSRQVAVKCEVSNITAVLRREREIQLDITLQIAVSGYSPLEFDYISAVELGDQKPVNTSGISLYISRDGDGILDLCKAFTAMPDDILAQNPALEFPLAANQRVIYFRHID